MPSAAFRCPIDMGTEFFSRVLPACLRFLLRCLEGVLWGRLEVRFLLAA